MKLEVEVVSKETIKPSSATPDHLRNYQLSFLDQISVPVHLPMIFFYESNPEIELSNAEKSERLKASLSKTLSLFYPLAGRLIGNVSIDCNDQGIPYQEAKVNCQLSQVIENPIPSEFNKFLPRELNVVDDILVAVQANFFTCGGMAISICTCHKVADALSVVMFVNSWAAAARGDSSNIICPQFDSAKLFPSIDITGFQPTTGITNEKIEIKRFHFSGSAVSALRDKYLNTYEDCQLRPSRVEALSAFTWSRFAAATHAMSIPDKIHQVLHAVNLRSRMDPQLPENSFGNLYRIAIAIPSREVGDVGSDLVRQMRDTVNNMDQDYVKNLQQGIEHLNFIMGAADRFTKGELVSFNFTSLCRMPLYETDFGWGKPMRFGSAKMTFKNLVTFLDTRDGDGVEAWINLKEEDMAKFEADEEFLSYVTPNK